MPATKPRNASPATNTLSRRAFSTQCVTCPPLEPCPVCPKGQVCQLALPPSCAQCPKYNCIPDPDANHSSSAGPIGGAVGGVLLAFVLAGFLFWSWRRRHQRAKAALRKARVDAKIRAAGAEKFRPGASKSNLIGMQDDGEKSQHSSARGDGAKSPSTNAAAVNNKGRKTPSSTDGKEGEEDLDDEDVEWTELREDGLTAFRAKPGQKGEVEQDLAALKRRSIGAATHLSRITEGAEDEEDDEKEYRRRSRVYDTIMEEANLGGSDENDFRGGEGHVRAHSSGASVGNEMNKPRSRKSGLGRASNPFLDAYDVSSIMSGTSSQNMLQEQTAGSSNLEHTNWHLQTPLEAPSRVHRPIGAPLVDLQGKPKQLSPSAASSSSRGGGSPIAQLLSPSPSANSSMHGSAPSRPMRKPDLNLRLEDGVEPGKIGEDLRKTPRSPGLYSNDANSERGLLSPAAPSSPISLRFDSRRNTMDSRKTQDFPAELAKSPAYNKEINKFDRRNSTMTTNTVSTVGTFDYVMSAPQIVTPANTQGPKRMQLNTGKAHLVRSLSAIRREQEEQKANRAQMSEIDSNSYLGTESHTEDPFSDVQGTSTPQTRRSPSPANTFGRELASPAASLSTLDASTMPPFAYRGFQASRPQSTMSGASLPFVDRPLFEPTDRSPTDAHPRESIATLGSQRETLLPLRASGMSGRPLTNVSRQSAASIGGLSVFDEIPFHIGAEDVASSNGHGGGDSSTQHTSLSQHVNIEMPQDAHSKIHEAKQRIASQASSHHTVEMGDDDESSPFGDHNASSDPRDQAGSDIMEDLRSVNNDDQLRDVEEDEVDDLDSLSINSAIRKEAPLRTGTNPEFDQIRLRHELDNYPFNVEASSSKS
ncbi:uncharacterized protein FA14DRAFT_178257 [Meira miltonrushii]|uniref:Membrane anchor Opy2 N-terminal domain-containing protein n=1 Tax=Meira miltonrushii TaxID=1280837 RepID=A0A316VC36_9BASI|nr:uncharacterized protein FA14DRAFT_178257 [Meira miltonrushii]PWN34864.1 hypothetical protein FA14DRAFT_178257 [Meira miltonrushii]